MRYDVQKFPSFFFSPPHERREEGRNRSVFLLALTNRMIMAISMREVTIKHEHCIALCGIANRGIV